VAWPLAAPHNEWGRGSTAGLRTVQLALAGRSSALRSTQNSLPSGSSSTAHPEPSEARRSSCRDAPRLIRRSTSRSRGRCGCRHRCSRVLHGFGLWHLDEEQLVNTVAQHHPDLLIVRLVVGVCGAIKYLAPELGQGERVAHSPRRCSGSGSSCLQSRDDGVSALASWPAAEPPVKDPLVVLAGVPVRIPHTERRAVPRARRLQAVADLISPLVIDYPKGQAGRAGSN